MKGSEFVFDCVLLLYYKCNRTNPNCGGSYIDSPDWIKKTTTIIPINVKDRKCFQYAVTVTLNHEEIGKQSERIKKLNLLSINMLIFHKYFYEKKWEAIHFPSEKDEWKKN